MICDPDVSDAALARILRTTIPDYGVQSEDWKFTPELVAASKRIVKNKQTAWYSSVKGYAKEEYKFSLLLEMIDDGKCPYFLKEDLPPFPSRNLSETLKALLNAAEDWAGPGYARKVRQNFLGGSRVTKRGPSGSVPHRRTQRLGGKAAWERGALDRDRVSSKKVAGARGQAQKSGREVSSGGVPIPPGYREGYRVETGGGQMLGSQMPTHGLPDQGTMNLPAVGMGRSYGQGAGMFHGQPVNPKSSVGPYTQMAERRATEEWDRFVAAGLNGPSGNLGLSAVDGLGSAVLSGVRDEARNGNIAQNRRVAVPSSTGLNIANTPQTPRILNAPLSSSNLQLDTTLDTFSFDDHGFHEPQTPSYHNSLSSSSFNQVTGPPALRSQPDLLGSSSLNLAGHDDSSSLRPPANTDISLLSRVISPSSPWSFQGNGLGPSSPSQRSNIVADDRLDLFAQSNTDPTIFTDYSQGGGAPYTQVDASPYSNEHHSASSQTHSSSQLVPGHRELPGDIYTSAQSNGGRNQLRGAASFVPNQHESSGSSFNTETAIDPRLMGRSSSSHSVRGDNQYSHALYSPGSSHPRSAPPLFNENAAIDPRLHDPVSGPFTPILLSDRDNNQLSHSSFTPFLAPNFGNDRSSLAPPSEYHQNANPGFSQFDATVPIDPQILEQRPEQEVSFQHLQPTPSHFEQTQQGFDVNFSTFGESHGTGLASNAQPGALLLQPVEPNVHLEFPTMEPSLSLGIPQTDSGSGKYENRKRKRSSSVDSSFAREGFVDWDTPVDPRLLDPNVPLGPDFFDPNVVSFRDPYLFRQ